MTVPTFTISIYDTALADIAAETNIVFADTIYDGNFSTSIDGGFKTAAVSLMSSNDFVRQIYHKVAGYPAIIFDDKGSRVFEGKILKKSIDGAMLKLQLVGHYSHAKEKHCGLVYPTSTPTSISDVIEDVVGLGTGWDGSINFIEATTTDITPLDFTGEKKLKDAIEEVLKFGNDDTPPERMHFQVWDHRTCHLSTEASIATEWPDYYAWVVPGVRGAIVTTMSMENIFNKIQVFYDDPNLDGTDFTTWEQDTESQDLYGVIEGSYSLGESTASLAGLVAEMLLTRYSKPEQSFTLNINNSTGYIRGSGGRPQHMMRAGDVIRVDSIDTAVDFDVSDNPGKSIAQAVAFSTNYNIKSGSLSVTLGTKAAAFDFLMTRLGYSVGSMS